MSFEVKTIAPFEKSVKALSKRHASLKRDLNNLIDSLEKNPFQGDEIFRGVRKIRLAITSKGRGKSGGARVITYTILTSEIDGIVYLMDIYDKSYYTTVDTNVLKQIIAKIEELKS